MYINIIKSYYIHNVVRITIEVLSLKYIKKGRLLVIVNCLNIFFFILKVIGFLSLGILISLLVYQYNRK